MGTTTRPKNDPDPTADDTAPEQASDDRANTGAVGDNFWERLTSPFPVTWIERLPKNLSKDDRRRGKCEPNGEGRFLSADGVYCGGYHARAVHLDYIGHAGITMRLNEVCTPAGWSWEPMVMARAEGGEFPAIPRDEFWIWLSIKDPDTGEWIRKQGVGDDYRGSAKQAIGDALRNAAMRFGIGTYLWSKSEHAAELAGVGQADPAPDRGQEQEDGDGKPSASQVYDAIRNSWHDYDRIQQIRQDIEDFGYSDVQVQGPHGKVTLLELAESRGMDLAEARQNRATAPQEPDEAVDQRPAAERIREAHERRQQPAEDADADAMQEHADGTDETLPIPDGDGQ